MGPRSSLDRCEKSLPPPGFDPQTIQPVASRYTNYTILAHIVAVSFAVKLNRMDRIMILFSLNKFVDIVAFKRL